MPMLNLTVEQIEDLIQALRTRRSLPASTIRQYPEYEARSKDPKDPAADILARRLPDMKAEYERCLKEVEKNEALTKVLEEALEQPQLNPLAAMVQLDEQMEKEHPGWMTGETLGVPDLDTTKYPIEDWKYEVANDDTSLGYAAWVLAKIEAEED